MATLDWKASLDRARPNPDTRCQGAGRRKGEQRLGLERRAETRFEPGKWNRRSGHGRRGGESLGLC